ncbi:type II toxin-antitoxin system Phd/YefM family antitoxin [Desulforamulus ruminis]|uniref:Antitoxin n=1 Tax=Desulforamulus ruminis (strain ATCC 23193 / DSM 2154 / NCIMB 8452 / DL) TaxID=696281 RepID=F6DTE4_DESRL|nr:type II toxin-antitoxin system Phd/YefM family antitoxin [Desulforamulus ruminis]AEG58961.1 prevent-host-death family protein [Desulforamulus ruminis DSM 2154]
MKMISITDMRRNAKDVLSEVVNTKKPVVILQRSKPVAYLVDAESYEKMQHSLEADEFKETRMKSLETLLRIKEKTASRTGKQGDSTVLIRELREGIGRHE